MAPQARDEAASQNLTSSLHHSPIHDFGAKSQFRSTRFRSQLPDWGQTIGSCAHRPKRVSSKQWLGGNGDDDLSVSAFVRDRSTVRGGSLIQGNGGFDECSKVSSVKLLAISTSCF
jgi:hypothetical protein